MLEFFVAVGAGLTVSVLNRLLNYACDDISSVVTAAEVDGSSTEGSSHSH